MKIKFCGMCRPEDAAAAAELGADYVGVILTPGFPRSRSATDAREIYKHAATLQRVGVFVNAGIDEIQKAISELELNVVQLHGNENAGLINAVRDQNGGVEIWKAKRVATNHDVELLQKDYADIADALLVDRNQGAVLDLRVLQNLSVLREKNKKLIIAGNLNPQNVAQIIAETNADAADVSSGIEVNLGQKSKALMQQFIENAKANER